VQDDKDRNNQDKGLIAFNKKKIKELQEEMAKLTHKNDDITVKTKDRSDKRKELDNKITQLMEKRREKDQEIKKKEDKIQELKRKNFDGEIPQSAGLEDLRRQSTHWSQRVRNPQVEEGHQRLE